MKDKTRHPIGESGDEDCLSSVSLPLLLSISPTPGSCLRSLSDTLLRDGVFSTGIRVRDSDDQMKGGLAYLKPFLNRLATCLR